MASISKCAISFTALSSVDPLMSVPSSFTVNCATIGRPGATSFTARIACSSSFARPNVSRTKRSTPPSKRPRACSLNASLASSYDSALNGSSGTPSGPIDPATSARSFTAAFAISAPRRLIS
jgi:hypothetical protein